MKQLKDQTKITRKKTPSQLTSVQFKASICTANLKFDFLTNEPGKILLELRKVQINLIVDNIKLITQPEHHLLKKYKKIMLILGSPGTGKTSSIKQSLNVFTSQCQAHKKELKSIRSIKILTFNANSFRKCDQILKQIQKIAKQKEYQGKIRCSQIIINIKGNQILNIIYIQQIDQVIINNNEATLQGFIQVLHQSVQQQDKNKKSLKIINKYLLIGGSNSINLDQILLKKVNFLKNQDVFTKIFKPYSPQQLLKICLYKLSVIKQQLNINIDIEQKTLKYIIMKLQQNKRDDTRNIIQIIKQLAIYAQNNSQVQSMLKQCKIATIQITLQQIHNIPRIRNMIVNSKIGIIQKLNYKQHIILTILYKYLKNSDDLEMPYLQIVQQFKKLQKNAGIIAYEDVKVAVSQLQTYGCIRIKNNTKSKNNKNNSSMSILLKIGFNQIKNALSTNPILAKYFQQ